MGATNTSNGITGVNTMQNYKNTKEIDTFDEMIGNTAVSTITLSRVNGMYIVSYISWSYTNNKCARVYKSLGKATVAFKSWCSDTSKIPQ